MNIEMRLETGGPLFDGRAQEILRHINRSMMTEAVEYLQGEIQQKIEREKHVFTNKLRGSISTRVNEDGTEARVFTNVAYGIVVEEGRRPGQKPPPAAPLALWLRRKHGVPEDEAMGMAFNLAKKIGRIGTQPVRMFARTLAEGDERLRAIVARHQQMLTDALGGDGA